jgi:hypothetical protein
VELLTGEQEYARASWEAQDRWGLKTELQTELRTELQSQKNAIRALKN